MVKNIPWKTKKKQQRWKISRLIETILDSFKAILRPKRFSSLCHSLRSKRWPGQLEISANGWFWIAVIVFMAHISFCWCSSSTGISTIWASFISAIVEHKWDKIELYKKPITQERKQNNEPEDFEKKKKETKPEFMGNRCQTRKWERWKSWREIRL